MTMSNVLLTITNVPILPLQLQKDKTDRNYLTTLPSLSFLSLHVLLVLSYPSLSFTSPLLPPLSLLHLSSLPVLFFTSPPSPLLPPLFPSQLPSPASPSPNSPLPLLLPPIHFLSFPFPTLPSAWLFKAHLS